MNVGFTLDSTEFARRFRKLVEESHPKAVRKGLGVAATRLLRDAIMEEPRVPLDEGTLRGSGSVFVEGELLTTSESMASSSEDAKPTPATKDPNPLVPGEIRATVAFNTEYAAYLHEHPEFEFKHSGTGGKYLETKMNAHREKYFKIAAATVRKEMGNA